MSNCKIYTKTGDKGQTSLVGGQRVSKGCERLESYGTIDELNSQIGLLITYCTDQRDIDFLTTVQGRLFSVGGYLATDNTQRAVSPGCTVTPEMVQSVEAEIDHIDALLPPLHQFILPGGSRAAAVCNVCRTVCRRAERCIIRLQETGVTVDECLTTYVNRLSDYLFILSRKLNADAKTADIIWR
jgi:cob(I)alamin adenosyltransferase